MCSEIVISQSERDMLLYSESIQKVMKNLEVFRQIQSAPQLYISAVVETVRRRTFSQAFLMVNILNFQFTNLITNVID